jgi:hypothetical protein
VLSRDVSETEIGNLGCRQESESENQAAVPKENHGRTLGRDRHHLSSGQTPRHRLTVTVNPPKAHLPGKGASCPQLERVAARSSRAGSGTTSRCGSDGNPRGKRHLAATALMLQNDQSHACRQHEKQARDDEPELTVLGRGWCLTGAHHDPAGHERRKSSPSVPRARHLPRVRPVNRQKRHLPSGQHSATTAAPKPGPTP